ncbi:MAG: RNA polymerase sigma factor [Prevotella sp.]|nr:RNA polymerase sigma factor [Prevotella sp.]
MTEQLLVEELKRGSRAAQRELYDRYAGYAMAVGSRYVPDADDVRDVLQDSFIKVFSSVPRFNYRGEGSLKAWVMRIVANEAVSFLRHSHALSRMELLTDEPQFPSQGETDGVPEEPDIGDLSMGELMRMIGELPAGYRTVFNLYVFENLTHKQIAALLDIGESTSASQYLRAKRMLANKINQYNKQSE